MSNTKWISASLIFAIGVGGTTLAACGGREDATLESSAVTTAVVHPPKPKPVKKPHPPAATPPMRTFPAPTDPSFACDPVFTKKVHLCCDGLLCCKGLPPFTAATHCIPTNAALAADAVTENDAEGNPIDVDTDDADDVVNADDAPRVSSAY